MPSDANGQGYEERFREQRRLDAIIMNTLDEIVKEPRSANISYAYLKRLLELHGNDMHFSVDQVRHIISARYQSQVALSLANELAKREWFSDEIIQELISCTDEHAMLLLRTALEHNRLIHLSSEEMLLLMQDKGGNSQHQQAVCAAVDNRLACFVPMRLSSREIAEWMEMRTSLACSAVQYLGERIRVNQKQGVHGFFVEETSDLDDGVSFTVYSAAKNNGETVCLVAGRKETVRQLFVGPYTPSLVSDLAAGNPKALAWMRDHPLTSAGLSVSLA